LMYMGHYQALGTNGQRLPQELVDEIIDHLTEETNSLKAFSLVSSSCFHYSRRHLFRSLIVTSNGNPSGFDHFLSYLQDKSDPTHSSYVQSLSLQAPSGLSSSPFPNLKTPLLLGILHHLPHLHHLTIRYTIIDARECPHLSNQVIWPSLVFLIHREVPHI